VKVIVVGGGVVGVATAFYLARAGAEVELLDRQPGVALETSYANAGQVSPGYSTPWAAPGIPLKAAKWMFQRHAPLAFRPDGTLFQLRWMRAMLANCNAASYARNKERMMRVAEYSRDCLRELRAELGLQYEQRSGGTLQLFRTDAQVAAAERDTRVLEASGVPHELLDTAGVIQVEPGLAGARQRIRGGLRLPNDETGDCYRFTVELAEQARRLGVRLHVGVQARRLLRQGPRITGLELVGHGAPVLQADHYVVALGSFSRGFVEALGMDLPIYPVKGYSLTIPLLDPAQAPVSTVLDETYKVALTRFDDRIRVGGMAELAGFDASLPPRRRETLELVTRELFPGGDLAAAQFWSGLRPMTPDSTPIIGATPYANLFLNTGHGTLGWTMACGSAKLLSDLMTGSAPAISTEGLAMDRYLRQGRAGRRREANEGLS